jgi:phospholipid N-methyltransferase
MGAPFALEAVKNFIYAQSFALNGEIRNELPEIIYNSKPTYTTKKGKVIALKPSIKLRFKGKPTPESRELLKKAGFQFTDYAQANEPGSPRKSDPKWYVTDTDETRKFIEEYLSKPIPVEAGEFVKQRFERLIESIDDYRNKCGAYDWFTVLSGSHKGVYKSKKELEKKVSGLEELATSGKLKVSYFRTVEKLSEGSQTQVPSTPINQPAIPTQALPMKYEGEKLSKAWEKVAERNKSLAEKLEHELSHKQNNTPKRNREYQQKLFEASLTAEKYSYAIAISRAYQEHTLPEEFHENYLKSDNARVLAQENKLEPFCHGTEHVSHYQVKQVSPEWKTYFERVYGIKDETAWNVLFEQIKEIKNAYGQYISALSEKERRILELEARLRFRNIPGFFPTPSDLISRMIELASLDENSHVLEPSAGKGDIAMAVSKITHKKTDVYEINPDLRQILELKDEYVRIIGKDFMADDPLKGEHYSHVLMNPPFENGQSIDHVKRAYKWLRLGGKLIAVLPESIVYRFDKKHTEFREWMENLNAYTSESIKEAFKSSFNQTGVTVRIISIEKPVSPAALITSETTQEEKEAEAALKLKLITLRLKLKSKINYV